MRNIIKHNGELQWTNTLLCKNISLTLYSLKGDVSCVWEVSWRRGQTAILTQSSSRNHSSTSSSSWLGLLNRGSLRAQSPLSATGSHFSILTPTNLNCPGHLVILLFNALLLLLFFCLFTQVHLLIDGSVEGQYMTLVCLFWILLRIKLSCHCKIGDWHFWLCQIF